MGFWDTSNKKIPLVLKTYVHDTKSVRKNSCQPHLIFVVPRTTHKTRASLRRGKRCAPYRDDCAEYVGPTPSSRFPMNNVRKTREETFQTKWLPLTRCIDSWPFDQIGRKLWPLPLDPRVSRQRIGGNGAEARVHKQNTI